MRATYDGAPGHPVVLGRRVMDAVGELEGDTGARDLLARFRVRDWEAGHLCSAADIDTREELSAAMKLEQSFEVQAPIDVVWRALNDLERVAPCLPGATITGHDDDGTYHGEFKVKLGPTTAAYRGTIQISEADEAAHKATLVAKGTDKRGQGGANATIVNTLTEADGATRVEAVTDFSITGRLARFGRGGMIEDISKRLLRDFGTCLATRLGEQPSGAEVTAGAAAPEALDAPPAAAPETTGAEVTAGDAAPRPSPPRAARRAQTPARTSRRRDARQAARP